ncbi:MAG: TatD family hydrolase [Candidatus Dormibacteria bacterium]
MAEPPALLVDAHCHLQELERRGLPAAEAVAAAAAASVAQVVTSGDGPQDNRQARDLAHQLPAVYFTVGWHPVNPHPPDPGQRQELLELLAEPNAVALGEVGLDFHLRPGYLETPPDRQRSTLAALLELAAQVGKPVVIHQRQAARELLEVLDQAPPVAVMLHCFSGGLEMARAAAERGLLCSFAGNLTFKSSRDLQEAARWLPSELLLVETDAPFLAPEPRRGRLCQPAMVRLTAQWLAALRGECLETIAALTTANAQRFFGLPGV